MLRCPYRPVICPNATAGCRQRVTAAAASSHAAIDCRFRSVQCPVSECEDKVAQARLEDHLRSEHFSPARNSSSAVMAAVFLALLLASLVTNWILYFHLMP